MSVWLACSFAVAFVGAAWLTPLSGRIAIWLGFLALPDPWVKGHVRATPLLGGGAILAGVAPVLLLCGLRHSWWFAVAGATGSMAVLGAWKDHVRREVSPLWQMAAQIAAIALLIFTARPVGMSGHNVAATGLSIVFCLWIVNGWNFLDVMDGLAGGVGMITAIFFAAGHAHIGRMDSAILSAALAGSFAGFLMHNYPPASIFMGDLGSFAAGILFCSLFLSGTATTNPHNLIGFGLMLVVPLFDVAVTSFTRMLARRSPLKGHSPDHVCLRLSHQGWSDRAVIRFGYLSALVTGIIGLSCVSSP